MTDGTIPLTESQQNTYYDLRALLEQNFIDVKPALVSATLDGYPVAVVIAIPFGITAENATDREFDIHPMAILVDNELLEKLGDRLLPPEGMLRADRYPEDKGVA